MHLSELTPQALSRLRLTLRNHLSFRHVHNYPLGPRTAAGLHALRKRFGSLPRQAGQRMLRKIARHVSSNRSQYPKYFTQSAPQLLICLYQQTGFSRAQIPEAGRFRSGLKPTLKE
jgi:hypothetical protein